MNLLFDFGGKYLAWIGPTATEEKPNNFENEQN